MLRRWKKNQKRNKTRSRRLRFESLEQRQVLAVTAFLSGGDLIIQGNSDDDVITLDFTADDTLTVTADPGTDLNGVDGGSLPAVIVANDIVIDMDHGDDTVTVNGNDFTLTGDLLIDGDHGDNTTEINNLVVEGEVQIENENGFDTIDISELTTTGDLNIDNDDGGADVLINLSVDIGGSLTIDNDDATFAFGGTTNTVDMDDVVVGGRVSITNGESVDGNSIDILNLETGDRVYLANDVSTNGVDAFNDVSIVAFDLGEVLTIHNHDSDLGGFILVEDGFVTGDMYLDNDDVLVPGAGINTVDVFAVEVGLTTYDDVTIWNGDGDSSTIVTELTTAGHLRIKNYDALDGFHSVIVDQANVAQFVLIENENGDSFVDIGTDISLNGAEVVTTGADLTVRNNGPGDSVITIGLVDVGDDLHVHGGLGVYNVSLLGGEDAPSLVADDLQVTIEPSDGVSTVSVSNFEVGDDMSVQSDGGEVDVVLGDPAALLLIDDDLSVSLEGDDDVSLLIDGVEVGDDFKYYGSEGDDLVDILDIIVEDNTKISTDNGNDIINIMSGEFNDKVSVRAGGGDDLVNVFSGATGAAFAFEDFSFDGGPGFDEIQSEVFDPNDPGLSRKVEDWEVRGTSP